MSVEEFHSLVKPIMTKYGQLCAAIGEIEADLARIYLDLLLIKGVEEHTMEMSLKTMVKTSELRSSLAELSHPRSFTGDLEKIERQVSPSEVGRQAAKLSIRRGRGTLGLTAGQVE